MANAGSAKILPDPQTPKTLGMLCIIFASLIMSCDTCTGFSAIFASVWARIGDLSIKNTQAELNKAYKQQQRELDRREAAAKTEQEKDAVKRDRDAFNARPKPLIPNTVKGSMDVLKDPVIARSMWVSLVTGLTLNALMLAGGIGLISLAEWGRKLTLWVAALKIARLSLLLIFSIVIAIPRSNQQQMAQFREIEAQQKAAAGGRAVASPINMSEMAKVSIATTYATTIGYYLVAPIFPVALLILLSRKRVRAAFYRRSVAQEREPELW
jgi:hypothetical protein